MNQSSRPPDPRAGLSAIIAAWDDSTDVSAALEQDVRSLRRRLEALPDDLLEVLRQAQCLAQIWREGGTAS